MAEGIGADLVGERGLAAPGRQGSARVSFKTQTLINFVC